ncbi:uncharacterized protein BO80DRAFT_421834 [Aspergillus ibericus CBS 121593]|uniref:Ketoreductase (KR) domain-containing protein n=1 Tax=Aspergillus ibericus CBS 121593 TaxID=1448316 RepID=A0A395H9H3_9EURO|nr:hypothetical protein BO80DRAFT_421834 [Aspergillus ibericus CBS 121593]RAL04567.1 hypothetical protein BO80DRAFT_421834 [Aspergillus ibericus CBS 121593]
MAQFNPDHDIPDLAGQVLLITGGTAGLGARPTLRLAQHGPQCPRGGSPDRLGRQHEHQQQHHHHPSSPATSPRWPPSTRWCKPSSPTKPVWTSSSATPGSWPPRPHSPTTATNRNSASNHLSHAMLIRTLLPFCYGPRPPSPRIVLLTSLGWQMHPRAGDRV